MQTTLRRPVALTGIGLHSARPVRCTIRPAAAEHGIWFKRTDVSGTDPLVPALWDAVVDTTLNTTIGNPAGVSVSTIEHLMAALAGVGIDNALVEVDGPEVPIMDGSALPFAEALLRAGRRTLAAPARAFRVTERVEVREGSARAVIEPAAWSEIAFEIEFPDAAIGRQQRAIRLSGDAFVRDLADSRTFCRRIEVETLRARGLALGGSLENAVVVEGARVLNPGGFRHADECVRHKMLDVVGDLALAGAPVIGRYSGYRAGHGVTNRLLRTLFATEGALEVIVMPARLPAAEAGLALAG